MTQLPRISIVPQLTQEQLLIFMIPIPLVFPVHGTLNV